MGYYDLLAVACAASFITVMLLLCIIDDFCGLLFKLSRSYGDE